jgi:deferrochelatase/peroxidase EfeB
MSNSHEQDTATTIHSFVTVAIPFDKNFAKDVESCLDGIGNPATPQLAIPLDREAFVHFLSMSVFNADDTPRAFIILELSADGTVESVLKKLADAIDPILMDVLGKAHANIGGRALWEFLKQHHHGVGQGWFSTPGVNFDGTPEMSVPRIRKEAQLARFASDILEGYRPSTSALEALEFVRRTVETDPAYKDAQWVFTEPPPSAPALQAPPRLSKTVLPIISSVIANLLWPFLLIALAVLAAGWILDSFGTGFWLFWLVLVLMFGVSYLWLRHKESSDLPDDIPPSAVAVETFMQRENFTAQNHLAAASTMKGGAFRRLTLRIGLWIAGQLAMHFSRPSFLGPTGVIHFARWILLPGTNTLLFYSNFDGAWESYLENFVEEAHQGVTGIWSNTVGFPKTSNLFGQGAADGDRLRRWTRRQQYPSRTWYTAYPSYTLARIRTNAAIRQGFVRASTEADAADWLSCFGSAPRPADALEVREIPTLLFGGMKRLRFATCLILRFGSDVLRNKSWLTKIESRISYGDSLLVENALVVGLSQTGLLGLGLSTQDLETFPVPFQHGSDAPWRARALGDDNIDDKWWWGNGAQNRADAILLIYADTPDRLVQLVKDCKDELNGIKIAYELPLSEIPAGSRDPYRQEPRESNVVEHFGFVDGVSQPIIRGTTQAQRTKESIHLVSPGEFIVGYPDNLGYLPPTASVAAGSDPQDLLPSVGFDPFRQRPDFSGPQTSDRRDLGRNGTFLVVRQLEQDVKRFNQFVATAAKALNGNPRLPPNLQAPLDEWIAAKMVGRWKDGTSLVRYPFAPGTDARASARPDNEFLFGKEDPRGLRCPFGAHIRRANPRESFDPGSPVQLSISNKHRIYRVGRPYPPQITESGKAGLMFMCLNVDIERQFEFVQQVWARAPSFHGLENEPDPILGDQVEDYQLTIPTATGPLYLKGMRDFVTVRGSGYFFLPGRTAVRYLSR